MLSPRTTPLVILLALTGCDVGADPVTWTATQDGPELRGPELPPLPAPAAVDETAPPPAARETVEFAPEPEMTDLSYEDFQRFLPQHVITEDGARVIGTDHEKALEADTAVLVAVRNRDLHPYNVGVLGFDNKWTTTTVAEDSTLYLAEVRGLAIATRVEGEDGTRPRHVSFTVPRNKAVYLVKRSTHLYLGDNASIADTREERGPIRYSPARERVLR
jgi:hypothetical protein